MGIKTFNNLPYRRFTICVSHYIDAVKESIFTKLFWEISINGVEVVGKMLAGANVSLALTTKYSSNQLKLIILLSSHELNFHVKKVYDEVLRARYHYFGYLLIIINFLELQTNLNAVKAIHRAYKGFRFVLNVIGMVHQI